jgi:hypothetical protein
MLGENFVDNCLKSEITTYPWAHTITKNHIDKKEFNFLSKQCNKLLEIKLRDMPTHKRTIENHITPQQFKDFNINWYDQMYDISKNIYENRKELCDVFPNHRWSDGVRIRSGTITNHRWFDDLVVSAYIGVTPPAPYDHIIHSETLSKIWSSVTYITPEKNCGTKMYTESVKESLAKEVEWKPNTTMIFAGISGKTWHSYNSTEQSNRITLNLFLKQKQGVKEYFYP